MWNGSRYPFYYFFLWNRCRDLFHIFLKQISTSISRIFVVFLWNGCWDSFHIFLKQISTFIHYFLFLFFCEMDVEICFTFFWNRSRHLFHYFFFCFFFKRMLRFVSHFSEMDLDIRFIQIKTKKIQNGCPHPFPIFLKWISTFVMIKNKTSTISLAIHNIQQSSNNNIIKVESGKNNNLEENTFNRKALRSFNDVWMRESKAGTTGDHHWREYLQMKEIESREGPLEKAEEETDKRTREQKQKKEERTEQKYFFRVQ